MLDAHFIRENLDAVQANCRNRHVAADVGRVLQLDDERKRFAQETQVLQQRQNEISALIPREKDKDKKQQLIQEGRELREKVTELESRVKQVAGDLRNALAMVPNMSHPEAPVGDANKIVSRSGEPRDFDFPVKDHVALAESLDLVDFEAGSSVAGPKFYYLKNDAV
ncbi:MAG: serine--tRNA ligase, partial [Planctomycetes bacterium]|nr:serine--tRNA ligase [Planctomycetota bacterium]